ncbi:hypothetical protein X801_06491 [Opisthorchis viverrini]|uniref:Uncharacterized protein n=1 Tax=Opisthorchis viverrini TaxID=6198 RepID=A0A1S8WT96_OPIVI|nr:hypothetical protein X801_06491 [Opisthorchis viverrini]
MASLHLEDGSEQLSTADLTRRLSCSQALEFQHAVPNSVRRQTRAWQNANETFDKMDGRSSLSSRALQRTATNQYYYRSSVTTLIEYDQPGSHKSEGMREKAVLKLYCLRD